MWKSIAIGQRNHVVASKKSSVRHKLLVFGKIWGLHSDTSKIYTSKLWKSRFWLVWLSSVTTNACGHVEIPLHPPIWPFCAEHAWVYRVSLGISIWVLDKNLIVYHGCSLGDFYHEPYTTTGKHALPKSEPANLQYATSMLTNLRLVHMYRSHTNRTERHKKFLESLWNCEIAIRISLRWSKQRVTKYYTLRLPWWPDYKT